MIQIPNKTEDYFRDEICVIGSDEQVKEFALFLTKHEIEIPKKVNNEVILKQIELKRKLYWLSIGRSKLQSLLMVVVGIERNGKLNPESNIVLEKNDILWIETKINGNFIS
jgi:CPA2 family monovalent cation:H+ antiporter-2